jgi:branched-chain amino acid aminotransferase
VRLLADPEHVRAWPGGTGNVKCGGNYGLTIGPQRDSERRSFDQILWLFGPDLHVTEVGTMNIFFFWINEKGELSIDWNTWSSRFGMVFDYCSNDTLPMHVSKLNNTNHYFGLCTLCIFVPGQRELITPPLDGTILPGVTRDSILALSRGWNEFAVSERMLSIHEIIEAINNGRVIEAFGAGTAAIVSPVKSITFQNKEYRVPLDPNNTAMEAGPLARRLLKTLTDIQYGDLDHADWSVRVD